MPRRVITYFRTFLLRHLTPPRTFVLSFAGVIFIGGFLLWLPFSATKDHLTLVDALFSSASAVCVTGLVVIDIGKDLSLAGQIITMMLFQCGGLGIITFSVFFFHLMGRSVSFKGREIVQSTFLHTPRKDFQIILKSVLLSTLIIESFGTVLLFFRFSQDFSPGQAFYHSIYNAISAFNNCGYSLFSDNLIQYQSDVIVNITIMGLIVLGGIGFIVQHEVLSRMRNTRNRLSLHTKIVLATTGILVVGGAVLFYLFEKNNIIRDASWQSKVLISLFQSITPRTAGFNTVDIGQLTNDTILLLMTLMFIGASPGSTGGGIKTTSTALLFFVLWNRLKGQEEVSVFNRTIPRETITRAISIIFASAFSIALITSIVLLAGPKTNPSESRYLFVEYLFDTISAFGTVGLTMGITPKLSDLQKILIMIMMFVGRVGPLTLAFSLSIQASKKSIVYAEENIMVG
ncbi:MAG TPA: TrkH family potassium uptake protein [Syntrophorhabdus sp.]|nr:TrkH family potassium uptake protein [Syntrophorhabdus sp.]